MIGTYYFQLYIDSLLYFFTIPILLSQNCSLIFS